MVRSLARTSPSGTPHMVYGDSDDDEDEEWGPPLRDNGEAYGPPIPQPPSQRRRMSPDPMSGFGILPFVPPPPGWHQHHARNPTGGGNP